MANWRVICSPIGGTCSGTTTIDQISPWRPYRDWLTVECDLATGHSMYVLWSDKDITTSGVGGGVVLQPGESITFDHNMPWTGFVAVLGFSGAAQYRGGEVYWEKA